MFMNYYVATCMPPQHRLMFIVESPFQGITDENFLSWYCLCIVFTCPIFKKQALRGYQIWYWEVCLGHKLGHVWGMSGAYLGHHLTACLGAVLDVSRATCISDAVSFCRYFVFIFGHRVIGCGYTAIWPPKPQPSQTLSPPVCKHNSLTC